MAPQLNFNELVQDERVHRKIYTEAEVFEAEMERIFESTWVFVGHESEVAAAGDYKTVTIGTQPAAIMTRDEDGGVFGLHCSPTTQFIGCRATAKGLILIAKSRWSMTITRVCVIASTGSTAASRMPRVLPQRRAG